MNIHVPPPQTAPTGPTPVLLTYSDFLRMREDGRLEKGQKYELLEGVLYKMPAEGIPHRLHRAQVTGYIYRALSPEDWIIIPDSRLLLSQLNAPEPDIYIHPANVPHSKLTGEQVSLVIEVAVSSIAVDSDQKARIYAEHGVPEYWIVDVERQRTKVLRDPLPDGDWREAGFVAFDETLSARHVPGLHLVIQALPHLQR